MQAWLNWGQLPAAACSSFVPIHTRSWAQLDVGADWPAADRAVHKMVMNVGKAPTFKDAEPKLR